MTSPVVRMWQAEMLPDKVAGWVNTYRDCVLPTMLQIDGFLGARFLVERDTSPCKVTVLTEFESMDAVRNFAGDDPGKTVLPDFMAGFFDSYADRATFYDEVLVESAK